MTFTGKEDHSITLEEASKLTRTFREKAEKDDIRAEYFGKETIQRILDQEKCVGIRMYFGYNNGTAKSVLVGVTAEGKDLTGGVMAEKSLPCPPYCDKTSPLNL